MKDSEKIRIIAEKLLKEFGETYRCDDMSDYYAPPELGLEFNHLGFLIEDNNKYITIKYRGYEVYNESTNHLSSNDINPIGWMDILANLYYDMPKTRRLIEKEVDFQKSADTFSLDYLKKIRRSC